MKKFLLALTLTVFLTGCGNNQELQNEWNSKYNSRNQRLDTIVSEINEGIESENFLTVDEFDEIYDKFEPIVNEIDSLLGDNNYVKIDMGGFDDIKLGAIIDFLDIQNNIFTLIDDFHQNMDDYSELKIKLDEGLSVDLIEKYRYKAVEGETKRYLDVENLKNLIESKEIEYNNTEFIDMFKYLKSLLATIVNSTYDYDDLVEGTLDRLYKKYPELLNKTIDKSEIFEEAEKIIEKRELEEIKSS